MGATASARGRAARDKGAKYENRLAAYLRYWWPDAQRYVRNGYRTPDRVSVDPMDIDGTGPGLCWSMKADAANRVEAWMAELDEKRAGRHGLLVVHRVGYASPGRWWCWQRAAEVAARLSEPWGVPAPQLPRDELLCTELRTAMRLLEHADLAPVRLTGRSSADAATDGPGASCRGCAEGHTYGADCRLEIRAFAEAEVAPLVGIGAESLDEPAPGPSHAEPPARRSAHHGEASNGG